MSIENRILSLIKEYEAHIDKLQPYTKDRDYEYFESVTMEVVCTQFFINDLKKLIK